MLNDSRVVKLSDEYAQSVVKKYVIVTLNIVRASKYRQKNVGFKTTGKPGSVILAIRKLRQEDEKFKISLSCIASSRPAWAIW